MKNVFTCFNQKSFFLVGILLIGFFTACSSDNDETPDGGGQTGNVSILSILPSTAQADDLIKVVGKNFHEDVQKNEIYINSNKITPYKVTIATEADTLFAVVPSRTGSGNVSIMVNGTEYTSEVWFEYLKKMKFSNIIGCVWGSSWGNTNPSEPKFDGAIGACIGADNRILLVEQWTHCIREVNVLGGSVSLYAGQYGMSGEVSGSLLSARLDVPKGITGIGSNKWLVFSDKQVQVIENNTVSLLGKKRDENGVHIYEGNVENVYFCNTSGVAYDEINKCVYFGCMDINGDTGINLHYILKLDLNTNQVKVVAGSVQGTDSQGTVDGYATHEGRVDNPGRMLVASDGSLYFLQAAGEGKGCIRRLKDGQLTTVAGEPGNPSYADGSGQKALFNLIAEGGEPGGGIVEDEEGNFLIADVGNHAIRKMTPQGVVTTISAMDTDEEGNAFPNKWAYKDDYDPELGNQLGASRYVAHPMYIFKMEDNTYGVVQTTGDCPGIRKIVFE